METLELMFVAKWLTENPVSQVIVRMGVSQEWLDARVTAIASEVLFQFRNARTPEQLKTLAITFLERKVCKPGRAGIVLPVDACDPARWRETLQSRLQVTNAAPMHQARGVEGRAVELAAAAQGAEEGPSPDAQKTQRTAITSGLPLARTDPLESFATVWGCGTHAPGVRAEGAMVATAGRGWIPSPDGTRNYVAEGGSYRLMPIEGGRYALYFIRSDGGVAFLGLGKFGKLKTSKLPPASHPLHMMVGKHPLELRLSNTQPSKGLSLDLCGLRLTHVVGNRFWLTLNAGDTRTEIGLLDSTELRSGCLGRVCFEVLARWPESPEAPVSPAIPTLPPKSPESAEIPSVWDEFAKIRLTELRAFTEAVSVAMRRRRMPAVERWLKRLTSLRVPEIASAHADLPFAEACALSGLSRNTLYRLAKDGHVPGARKLGARWRFERGAFIRWLEGK